MGLINHKLYIETINAYIDPIMPVENAIITHGHADHARIGHQNVLATQNTIDIMKIRYGDKCAGSFQTIEYHKPLKINNLNFTFYPAGHILGSAQILIETKNSRLLITGDYKTTPDSSCQSYELVECDQLITEATFGLPVFQHPKPENEIKKILKAFEKNDTKTYIIGAYALGKSQRVIKLLRDAGYDETIYLHGSQLKICDYYISQGINLGNLEPVSYKKSEDFEGKIVIAPPSALKDKWSRRFSDPVICYASGWMSIKQRAKQSLVEIPLIISDHCDWNELITTIKSCKTKSVWVTHGREDALVHWCKSNNINAEPLYMQGREEE